MSVLRFFWLGWVLAGLLGAGGAARAQTIRVSGGVADAVTRAAVPGATVRVQRTGRGVAASAQGTFAIETLSTDTLVFKALGFKAQRLMLGGSGLSALVVQIRLVRDSVLLGKVRVSGDRPDRAAINRALRNLRRPLPPAVSQVRRPPKPKPLFAVDSSAPKAPVPTLSSPVSLLYEQFSRAGKERRKMAEIEEAERAEKVRQARARYNRAFKDNRGYAP